MDFAYKPLNFWENMFVIHDFIYEPLNYQEIYLQYIIFKKMTLNFVITHQKPVVYEFLRMSP
jgi:hypothetical protein